MGWSKEEQYDTLDKFFRECVRFWEHELKTDSDLDNRPYINALQEIPKVDPNVPFDPRPIDSDVRERFVKHRCMDTYGKQWEEPYKKMI